MFDRITKIVDQATALPGKVARGADRVNDRIIDVSRDLEAAFAASGKAAERNLRANKIEAWGRQIGTWLNSPGNPWYLLIAVGAMVVVFSLMIRRL